MTSSVSDEITPGWLTAVLRQAGLLTTGEILDVLSQRLGAFNSRTHRLIVRYSDDALPRPETHMILKRNISETWAIEAGAEEVKFYQLVADLQPAPPTLVPCYASDYNSSSGDSYLLLQDLSETHEPPITREQQLSSINGIPSAINIDRVVDTLASHHAYWWNHPLLQRETFPIGYWSRNAERFALYLRRRQTSWQAVRTREANWLPVDVRHFYDQVMLHLQHHWKQYLEPRFRTHTHLTLIHGDSFFANFLCPKSQEQGTTYLLDWQSPAIDIGGYDLANLCATFWTSEQRHEEDREKRILERYYKRLVAREVTNYTWQDFVTDYQTGIIYWLLVPVQDAYDGASKDYWWPKMQCLVSAFRDWQCETLLNMNSQ